jgi:hypothetical protein
MVFDPCTIVLPPFLSAMPYPQLFVRRCRFCTENSDFVETASSRARPRGLGLAKEQLRGQAANGAGGAEIALFQQGGLMGMA